MGITIGGDKNTAVPASDIDFSTMSPSEMYKHTSEFEGAQDSVDTQRQTIEAEQSKVDPFGDWEAPANTDRLIANRDFDESPEEVAGAMRTNLTPLEMYAATKNPLETIMLHSDVDKDTALRSMSLIAAEPALESLPTASIDSEASTELLKYAEDELSHNKALQTFEHLKENAPDFVNAIRDPNIAKVVFDSTANGDLVWSQLHDLMVERNAGFFGRKWQALKAGASGVAKSTGEFAWATSDVVSRMNDGYIEELNNGGNTIEQDKSAAEMRDLENHYNGQISECEIQLNKHKGTDTGIKLARQIIDLEEKRDFALDAIYTRGEKQVKDEVLIAKNVAEDMKKNTEEIHTYLDSAPWLNKQLMSDASFFEKTVSATPQILQQILLYASGAKEVALGITGIQAFGSSYSRSRNEGVSIGTALVTASFRSIVEAGGEAITFGLIGKGTVAAKTLIASESVTASAVKTAGKELIKGVGTEVVTEASQNLLGTAGEAVGFAVDGVMNRSDIGEVLYNEGIVGSLEEGAIAGMFVLPSVGGITLSQGNRVQNARRLTNNLTQLVKRAEEIKDVKDPAVREKIIRSVLPESKPNTEFYKNNEDLSPEEEAVISETISKQMQEVKISAGAMNSMLEAHYPDATKRKVLLDSLGITEKELLLEEEYGGFVTTEVSKVLAHSDSVFWEGLAPYTLQYGQEYSLAEEERLAQAFTAVSESIKDIESAELTLTRAEREQAAVKVLSKVFPTKTDEVYVKSAATIMTRLFESIERGIVDSARANIMSNLSQGFAVRRGEDGQIHFMHKNNLADIRERRIKLEERKVSRKETQTNEKQPPLPEFEEVKLAAEAQEEAYFRGVSSVGEATAGLLATIDPNTDIYSLNGSQLIEALLSDGAVAGNEVELFVNEDGSLTGDGVEFVSNTLLSKLINNSAVLDSLGVNTKKKIASIAPFVLAVDSLSPNQSILEEFRNALLYTSKLKKKRSNELNLPSSKLDTWLNSRPKAHIEQAVRAYLETVRLGSSLSKDELIDEIIRSGERFLSKAEKQEKLTAKKAELEEAEIVTEIAIEEATAKLDSVSNTTQVDEKLQKQLEDASKEIELLKSQKEALTKDREDVERENFELARNADISLPSGKVLEAEFDLVEASELIISHDPETFAPNVKHGSGQERNYHTDTQLRSAIKTGSLDVRKVINNSPLPTSGAPIVDKSGIVHGGNGRSMRIARHYNAGNTEYNEYLMQNAASYGFTPEEIGKFERPILVRKLKSDVVDAGRLSAEVNDDDTQSKNQASESYGLANRLGENAMRLVDGIEENQSARDFIAENGSALITALKADGAISENDIAKLYDVKNDVVTEEGKLIIENALFGIAIHDLDVMSALVGNKKIKNKVVMISPLVVATKRRPDWDIANLLRIGAKHIIAKNNSNGGKSWSDYIAQQELFTTDSEMDKSGLGVDIGIWLDKTPAKKLREDLTSYINKIPTGETGSTDLFGGGANYTVEEALAELLGIEVDEINAKVQTFINGKADNDLESQDDPDVKDYLTPENTEEQRSIEESEDDQVYYKSTVTEEPTAEVLEETAVNEVVQDDQSVDIMDVLSANIMKFSRVYSVVDESGEGSLAYGRAWEYLLDAQSSYNPERGSYENWLKQSVRYACRDEAKKLRRHNKERGSLTYENSDGEYENAYFEPVAVGMSVEEIDGKVADAIGEHLGSTERFAKHKQVFDLFRNGAKQREIADKLGISQGRIAQIIKEIGNDKEIQEVERITRENIFYKENGGEFRGKISINDEAFTSLITLAKDGDVATFLHEVSHFYLNTVEQVVNNGKANAELNSVFTDIRKALGVKEGEKLTTENHEYFARSFEAYLTTGEAPTGALRKAFTALRRFATEVIRHFKELYGKDGISPEIRDVFDRMLLTEEELTRYRRDKNISKESEGIFDEAKKVVFGKDIAERKEKEYRDKKARQEERLFKSVQISFAKNNGYRKAKAAAEKTVLADPFYSAVNEIIDSGGIGYETIKELVGKHNADFLKRHDTKDKPFIAEGETEVILEDIANRHGYGERDNPVDALLDDLISKATTKDAINLVYSENKETVNNRLREELRNRDLLVSESTSDEVSEMLFDVVVLRMALDEQGEHKNDRKYDREKMSQARAKAKEQRQRIEEEVQNELNSMNVLEAANYKYRQREANKRGREVDSQLIKLKKILEKKKRLKKVSSEIIDKVELLQAERAYWQLSAKISLEIHDELQKRVKDLGLRRLQSKLNGVREDYKKSILDLIYSYRLPATIKEGKLDLNLLQRHNTKLDSLNPREMLLPHEVKTPVEERYLLDADPTTLMTDWIRRKERKTKLEAHSSSNSVTEGVMNDQRVKADSTYKDMTWSDFIEVANLVESYIQMGSEELDALKLKDAETVSAAKALLEKNTTKLSELKKTNGEIKAEMKRVKRFLREFSKNKEDAVRNLYRGVTATFAMQEFDMLRADGFKRGFMYKIFTDFRKAAITFNDRQNTLNLAMQPHYEVLSREVERIKDIHGRKHIKLKGLEPSEEFKKKYGEFTVDNIIAMCFNMGNDANLYALVEGMGFGAEKYSNWLKSLDDGEFEKMTQKEIYKERMECARSELEIIQNQLTEEGWKAVQQIWKVTGSLFHDLNTVSYKMYRKSLIEEEPTPLIIGSTADGKSLVLDGGYYPLRYDTKLTAFDKGESDEEVELNDRRNGVFGSTGINKASMYSRMRSAKDDAPVVKRPVLLDLNVLPQHIGDTVRIITHGAIIKDTQKVFTNLDFKNLYTEKFGHAKYNNLVKWLRYQGNPRMYQPTSIHGKLLNGARSLFTVKALALNIGVAAKQPLSIPNAINEMNHNGKGRLDGYRAFADGVTLVAKGAKDSIRKGKFKNETIEFVFAASDYIRDRDKGAYNLHLSDMKARKLSDPKMFIKGREVTRDKLTEFSFSLIHLADKSAVMPLWMGAFTQSLRMNGVTMTSNLNEMLSSKFEYASEVKDAIDYADHIISMTQPTTLSTDKAPIQLDTLGKAFSVFMTYTLRAFNKASYYKDKVKSGEMSPSQAVQTFIEMFVMPALISTTAGYFLASGDDEEKDALDFGADAGVETINQVKGTIPFMRSVGFDRYSQNFFSAPALEIGKDFWKPVKKVSEQKYLDACYSAAVIGSVYAGVPIDNGMKSATKIMNLVTTGSIKKGKK